MKICIRTLGVTNLRNCELTNLVGELGSEAMLSPAQNIVRRWVSVVSFVACERMI